MTTVDLYAVRTIADKQIVCFSTVMPILGELSLAEQVDEFHTVRRCEYARINRFSLGWGGRVPSWEAWHTGDAEFGKDSIPAFSEAMKHDDEDIEWSRFGSGFVYFLRAGARIKIGYSTNVKSRLKALQTASPERLEFIGKRPGSYIDETRLHEVYSHLRVAGEWFEYRDRLAGDLSFLRHAPGFQADIDATDLPYIFTSAY